MVHKFKLADVTTREGDAIIFIFSTTDHWFNDDLLEDLERVLIKGGYKYDRETYYGPEFVPEACMVSKFYKSLAGEVIYREDRRWEDYDIILPNKKSLIENILSLLNEDENFEPH